jgi:hypothetical protein
MLNPWEFFPLASFSVSYKYFGSSPNLQIIN